MPGRKGRRREPPRRGWPEETWPDRATAAGRARSFPGRFQADARGPRPFFPVEELQVLLAHGEGVQAAALEAGAVGGGHPGDDLPSVEPPFLEVPVEDPLRPEILLVADAEAQRHVRPSAELAGAQVLR